MVEVVSCGRWVLSCVAWGGRFSRSGRVGELLRLTLLRGVVEGYSWERSSLWWVWKAILRSRRLRPLLLQTGSYVGEELKW